MVCPRQEPCCRAEKQAGSRFDLGALEARQECAVHALERDQMTSSIHHSDGRVELSMTLNTDIHV